MEIRPALCEEDSAAYVTTPRVQQISTKKLS
jgi:hypothetical protein